MKRYSAALLGLLAALCMFAAACDEVGDFPEATPAASGAAETDAVPVFTQEPSDAPSETLPAETLPAESFAFTNPLTGEPCPEDVGAGRPVAVILNNLKPALPQCGIEQADILYEALAEGGITRMVAVYQQVPDIGSIGSIRSARPYYLDIALSHDAVFVHAGGSPQAYLDIRTKGAAAIDGVNGGFGGELFFRDKERMARAGYEHSMFTTGKLLLKYLPTYGLRLEHREGYGYEMSFSDDAAPPGGQAAEKVTVYFTSSKSTVFDYSAADGLYCVGEYGAAYVDGNTGQQKSVKNLLVLYARVATVSGDTEGRLTTELVGSGGGYFACGGKMTAITWSREDYASQFKYSLPDGTPLALGIGKSYVCVVPDGSTVAAK